MLQTLTDIIQYKADVEGYEKYSDRLLGIMRGEIDGNITKRKPMNATNQILYGPPGTGKTYYLRDQLFDKYASN